MKEILEELERVHDSLAYRDNASSVTIQGCASLGKDFPSSVAAALMTIGETHAPLKQTALLLCYDQPWDMVSQTLKHGKKVPGWGSSFIKGEPDLTFSKLDLLILEHDEKLWNNMNSITKYIQGTGLNLWPNAACYTIASLLVAGKNVKYADRYFIEYRLNAWHHLYTLNYKEGPG